VALNVGGSLVSKRWPIERWAALTRALADGGRPSLFVGGPNDVLLAEMVREHLPPETPAHFAVGRLSFLASTALLSRCVAHVSGDTGLMQAGLALDAPTVALFGPDDPAWTGPYPNQQRAVVVRADQSSRPEDYDRRKDKEGILMKTISVESVVEALGKLEC
jgi:ADP-heptose:LPS heptosyltransferase